MLPPINMRKMSAERRSTVDWLNGFNVPNRCRRKDGDPNSIAGTRGVGGGVGTRKCQ